MNCGAEVPVPLGVCLTCGGSALWANLDGEDFAVEAGPVASMNFRRQAVEFLESHLDGVDPVAADKLLKAERVRVAEGLDKTTAESMRDGMGVKETTSRVTRGPTPKAGAAGAMRNGLPVLGLAGLALAPVLGWAIAAVVATVGVAGLAAVNMQRPMPTIGKVPVGPLLETDINGLARRIVAAKGKLSESGAKDLDVVARTAFTIVAQVTDPEDVVALGTGGFDGGVSQNAIQMATRAALVAEAAVAAGRDDFNEEEREAMGRLKAAVSSALKEMAQLSSGASSIDKLEAMMAEEVEMAREMAEEFDALEV